MYRQFRENAQDVHAKSRVSLEIDWSNQHSSYDSDRRGKDGMDSRVLKL